MRCYCCNKNLSDAESTRKLPSGDYADLCHFCFFITFGGDEPEEEQEEDDLEESINESFKQLFDSR